jgi:hypothetical protein
MFNSSPYLRAKLIFLSVPANLPPTPGEEETEKEETEETEIVATEREETVVTEIVETEKGKLRKNANSLCMLLSFSFFSFYFISSLPLPLSS